MPTHVHKLVEVKCLAPPKPSVKHEAIITVRCTCGGGFTDSPRFVLAWWERHLDEHLASYSVPFVRYAHRVAP